MQFTVKKLTSAVYTAVVTDETGARVPGSTLDTLILTVYDLDTGDKLNARDGQNVLNANGVTVDAEGTLTWAMAPEDSDVVDSTKACEDHRAVFEYTWNGKRAWHRVDLSVTNEAAVTA